MAHMKQVRTQDSVRESLIHSPRSIAAYPNRAVVFAEIKTDFMYPDIN
jgi:hypothetical protein